MDYKATLNLPSTSFPMRGNLPQAEPQALARWEAAGLYEAVQKKRAGKTPFILHDGPPYANGDIHMGHVLNKVLKDFVVRYRSMRGFRAPYIPGWDCHGLPIEYALMKELKVTKHEVDQVEFRKKARAYALKFVEVQREQFKRLGVTGDWAHPYLTLEPGYAEAALRILKQFAEQELIYRARRPVNWCWSCETALAEAEVEYEDHKSPSIYVKFEIKSQNLNKIVPKGVLSDKVYLVIWTTTPWTLSGNVAVAVHPDFQYALRPAGPGEFWITAEPLPPAAGRDGVLKGKEGEPLKTFSGRELEGLTYDHPFGLRTGRVVLADYVSMEEGTGLVHTAPGFGAEDYGTGRKYKLEIIAPVDARGKFTGLTGEMASFNGQQVQEANGPVIDALRASNHLIARADIAHSYPHCWRCRNPIIFRATDQWFLKIDQGGLREKLLKAIREEVTWIPPAGRERLASMVAGRPDWCLSRQRFWGIPIPAVICERCGEGRLLPEVIARFAEVVGKEPAGTDLWFSSPADRWLPKGFRCGCGGTAFKPGSDILDVWFDSGVSHAGVLRRRAELTFPADLYLEGSDQHRGWFQVSLITAVAQTGKPPYKGVLTHGFVVDGQGRKMSKSLGNVIAPKKLIAERGADPLRLWVASADYREDVRLSPEILDRVTEEYRKIRNTIRYCLANLAGWDPAGQPVPADQLQPSERWVLAKLNALIAEVTDAYDGCQFHRVSRAIHGFCTVVLSNFYLDIIKDRLYTAHPNDPARRSAQSALYQIASALIRMIAPVLPVTADEAWRSLRGAENDPAESVHLQDWPAPAALPPDGGLQADWDRLLEFRDEAMKVLESARAADQIGNGLEAQLQVAAGGDWEGLLARWKEWLAPICVVSGVALSKGKGLAITAAPAAGRKCQRCWMRLASVGESSSHPELCGRCVPVVEALTSK
ncbi:MAG: isoleucine--tRNA ligase [Candidatus Omnitrophica bacterium CG11_big_fil_rev_8_21_14_0_20_64_10]|nr:MAG: isoleucine--tRNA ligase [Candidatus Omnitrophica bacterium CG11_big_fil_rev_8_21_14_0_20_64_10]